MGFTTPNLPPVDPATFMQMPYRDRVKALARHWVDNGNGSPGVTIVIYVVKLLVATVAGALIATLTSDLDPLAPGRWWDQPIVWQKLVLWVVLLESLGVGGSWGPLAGRYGPLTGGLTYFIRPGTLRIAPWPGKVPFTGGDERTRVDVVLYGLMLVATIVPLVLPGSESADLTAVAGSNAGLVPGAALIPLIALQIVLSFRDKAINTAARVEQYLPALIFFAFFDFTDMIVGAKLLICSVWFGAGFAKVGRHFPLVVPMMVSNTPWVLFDKIKRRHYADPPHDLRPSKLSRFIAHGPAAAGEMVPAVVLLFSQNPTVTAVAAVFMVVYHLFIISTIPLAVPLEWNALFMYLSAFLFLGFPNHEGFGLSDMDPVLLAVTAFALLFSPVLGNLRPDLVSFLPAMRQYSGNWAAGMWAFAPGAEAKLDEHLVKPAPNQKGQIAEAFTPDEAQIMMHGIVAFRAMHSQGRGLNSVLMNQLGDDMDVYEFRDGEFAAGNIVGFNFGDGHLHDQRLIRAMQKRCQFAPGEFIVVWAESEPFGGGRQQYWVMDAAVGEIERGSWSVKEAVAHHAWLPDGPIGVQVDWRRDGYERVRPERAPPAPAVAT